MKARWSLFLFLFGSVSLFAQDKMYIHKSDHMTLGALIAETDSIYFTSNETIANFRIGDTLAQYPTNEIDSITFGPDSDTVFVIYNGAIVTVINPLAFEGVAVTVENANVTVNSVTEEQDIHFCLSGTTSDGTFKIYSAKRFNLLMNGVNITNPDGPAINVQSKKKCSVKLETGSSNSLTDGVTYSSPPVNEEQDATFFSEAKLVFSGSGSLTINGHGSEQHGLGSDDEIEFDGGTLSVTSSAKDGIHAGDGFLMTAGTINLTPGGDGIDGDSSSVTISGGNISITCNTNDVKGITCDSSLLIAGGMIDITMNGDQSKALMSDMPLFLNGGTIDIVTTGDAVLEPSGSGYDPAYCTAIKSNEDITIGETMITINATGKAGKGISSDSDIVMTAGNVAITTSGNGAAYTNPNGVKQAYVSTCFSTDIDLKITGGTVTTSSSGSGGKGFSSDFETIIGSATSSPSIDITTTGTRILISGSGPNANYAEAKAIKSDSAIHIIKGNIHISSADDGIKSNKSVDFDDVAVMISQSTEGVEAPFITINGDSIRVYSSDDCINATFGYGGEKDDGSLFTMNGGYLMTNTSGGDGLDSNGDMLVTNGTTVVHGPPFAPEVGMDVNGTCNVNGGFLVISGTNSKMTEPPSSSSTQYSVKVMMNQSLSASTLFHIQDATANSLLTFQPARQYYSIIFSSADLQQGSTYSIYTGGTCTGTNIDGLYTGGVYSGGTFRKSFTISSKITNVTF